MYYNYITFVLQKYYKTIEVRVPKLRKRAKEIAKQDYKSFFEKTQDEYYEELAIQKICESYRVSKEDKERIKKYKK